MPRTNIEPVQFHVPAGQKATIEELAKRRDKTLSEYLRYLVEADAQVLGVKVDMEVHHGGANKKDA
jgi:hypothetical protein